MNKELYNKKLDKAIEIQKKWRQVPAPKRGELIRLFGEELRISINDIADSIQHEAKKIKAEAV